ncbi:copper chaperone PCu(A)C [Schauerella aestuarii]|uniref:copper chaperone PCu(A)C n=1 Tax=Schauerella aestuarii TaxID=2511204 RepID=UPI00136D9A31|nr:copper chaperone PCu(A)C [Achromobacter aestuarii]MYZ44038.1 copper chaperone PCu(A)C [Achromobacter aestuarii]
MTSLFRNTIFTFVIGSLPMAVMAHHLPEDGAAASATSATSTAATAASGHGAPASMPAASSAAHAGHGAMLQSPGDATERALAQGRAEQLSVQGCWIRAMPAQVPSAGYFTVTNAGRAAAKLTGIVVPGYGMAMLHQTQKTGGMAKMTMAHEIDVPAKGNLTFAPGGYHAMLEKPSDQARIGALLPVAFQFASGAQVNASCKVQPASALGPD